MRTFAFFCFTGMIAHDDIILNVLEILVGNIFSSRTFINITLTTIFVCGENILEHHQ